jgi:hypothetical protein
MPLTTSRRRVSADDRLAELTGGGAAERLGGGGTPSFFLGERRAIAG